MLTGVMVGVFLCGPGGAGKTTLVNAARGDGGGRFSGFGLIQEVAR